MKIIKAPNDIFDRVIESSTVFLAGSIEMGKVENWQAVAEKKLSDYDDSELTVFNPRRDDFDVSLKQTIHEPVLKEQIYWELDSMESADYLLVYFHPDTKAPITMLELGLHAHRISKVVVVCPDGFYRQANIEIVCEKFNIPFFKSLDEGITQIRSYVDYDKQIIKDE